MNFNPASSSLRTSTDSSPLKPIAMWNHARGVWETEQGSLFCEHSAVFSETWPISGTMRNGIAYELPTPGHPTDEPGFSFLGTPTSRDYKGVPGKNVQMASLPRDISLLPTPNRRDEKNDLPHQGRKRWNRDHYISRGEGDLNLPGAIALLSTPNTMDWMEPKTKEQIKAHRDQGRGGDRNIREDVLYELPAAEDNAHVDFGKYEAAVRRWEPIIGREAPNPTEPATKGLRLSPRFTEWVMGLPEGWVTDVDISRKAQLHALGNGVVPQQAELALRILLEGLNHDSCERSSRAAGR